ncbi:MAG: site-specific integrase [Lentimonas sp.]
MASVHKKPNSPYWMMKYRAEDGRVVMRSTKQTEHRKAKRVADETERMAEKARSGELTQAVFVKNIGEMIERSIGEVSEVVSITDFFQLFLQSKEAGGSAVTTINRYRKIFEDFVNSLPAARRRARIGSLTPVEVERFRDAERASGKSASTCDFIHKVISSALAAAHRKCMAPSNPALAIDTFKEAPEERLPFTNDQVKALLGQADSEWFGMILFGFHCGMRLNDAANLKWGNIDQEEYTVTFLEQKTAGRKRRANPETSIVLHPDLIAWLKSQPTAIEKAPLFPSLAGKTSGSAGGLSNAFNDLMCESEIVVPLGKEVEGKGRRFRKLGFHSLRHTMISNLANADVSADVRKTMSGHSSDEIHQRYVHLNLDSQRKAIDGMGSVVPD